MAGPTDITARGKLPTTPVIDTVVCPSCAKVLEGEPNFCNACGGDLRGIGGHSDTLSGAERDQVLDGRYRLLEKLGEGGMGSVFKVEHVRMGKIAALKVMRPDAAVDKGLKARFLQESRVVARLSHPNTVQVFDAGELEDGSLFMAMEYVPGKDLAWHLRTHGRMTEASAVSIGVQLLASLSEAHEAGVVHRDIKPANVMLLRRRKGGDQVKLLDFGIAKLAEGDARNSTTGDFVGTPAYMSPEQVRGEAVDARSDLYSVGALLFELVTGQQLYTGPTAVSIVKQHLEQPIPRVTDHATEAPVSPAFERIVTRALAKSADARFSDAESMRRELEALNHPKVMTGDFTPMPDALAAKMLSREDFEGFERRLKLQRALAPIAALLVLLALGLLGWRLAQHAHDNAGPAEVELEPNDQVQRATLIALGGAVRGTMGASGPEQGDRDLFVATVPSTGAYRLRLGAVADLNLTVEVLQVTPRLDGGTESERLRRMVFLDDVGAGEPEQLEALTLNEGPVYLRVEEQPFCTEPNRPPREKALVPYTLQLEPMERTEGFVESEPNDTALTADALPLTRAAAGWLGHPLEEADRLAALRPDGPFSAVDYWRVDAAGDEHVVIAVVPPERGSVFITDEAELEAWRLKKAQSTPGRPAPPMPSPLQVRGKPALVPVKAGGDGVRRFRVVPGRDTVVGAQYHLAAATSGLNGVTGLLDLMRALESRVETRRQLLESAAVVLKTSPELARLHDLQ